MSQDMPRYDKYDPVDGGFRAPLAAAVVSDDAFTIFGVGLDSSGTVVRGAGQTGVIGVMISHGVKAAGDIVDVMTDGEIVEAGLAAGTVYGANTATGVIGTGTGAVRVGHTVEASRLIVRAQPGVTLP